MEANNTERASDAEAAPIPRMERLGFRNALYRAGGAAALVAALLFRRNLGAEFMLLKNLGAIHIGPPEAPTSASEWFALLESNRLVGLTLFNVFDLVNYALLGVVFVALYAALRRAGRRVMAIAITLGLAGIVVAFASSRALAMLALSGRYAVATTETERATLLAQGEALLAVDNPGAAYRNTGATLALFLVTLSAVMISVVMLRSANFSRATAYLGLVAEGVQLGYFVAVALALPPALLAIPPSAAAPFRLAWYLLIGRRLLQLARAEKGDGRQASS
jgi:hypothetical protein